MRWTEQAPALCPKIVTFLESPPNFPMFLDTHRNADSWSFNPRLPGRISSSVDKNPGKKWQDTTKKGWNAMHYKKFCGALQRYCLQSQDKWLTVATGRSELLSSTTLPCIQFMNVWKSDGEKVYLWLIFELKMTLSNYFIENEYSVLADKCVIGSIRELLKEFHGVLVSHNVMTMTPS